MTRVRNLLLQEVVPSLCTEAGTRLTLGVMAEVAAQEAVAGQLPPVAGLVAAPPISPLRAVVSNYHILYTGCLSAYNLTKHNLTVQ